MRKAISYFGMFLALFLAASLFANVTTYIQYGEISKFAKGVLPGELILGAIGAALWFFFKPKHKKN